MEHCLNCIVADNGMGGRIGRLAPHTLKLPFFKAHLTFSSQEQECHSILSKGKTVGAGE